MEITGGYYFLIDPYVGILMTSWKFMIFFAVLQGGPSITKNLVSRSHPGAQTLQVASDPRTLGAPEQWVTTQLLKGIWRKVFQNKWLNRKKQISYLRKLSQHGNPKWSFGRCRLLLSGIEFCRSKKSAPGTWNRRLNRTSFSRRATSASARCSLATWRRWSFLRALVEDRNPKKAEQHQSGIQSIWQNLLGEKWTQSP